MVRKYSMQEYASTKELYKKFGNYNEVARSLNMPSSTVKLWLKTDAVPMSCSKKFKNNMHKASLIAAVNRTKKLPDSAREISEDFAFVLGVMQGDGCVSGGYPYRNRKRMYYRIILNTIDYDFAIEFKNRLEKWSGMTSSLSYRPSKVPNWKDQWHVVLYSNEASKFLRNFNLSDVLDFNEKEKGLFLRGFFDSEGSVYFTARRNEVKCFNTNKATMFLVDKMLHSIGIKKVYWYTSFHSEMPCYRLSIHSKADVQVFNEKVGFSINRKQRRVEEILKKPDMRGKWDRKKTKMRKMAKSMI